MPEVIGWCFFFRDEEIKQLIVVWFLVEGLHFANQVAEFAGKGFGIQAQYPRKIRNSFLQ